MLLLAAVLGVGIGISLGALGGGGSILTVPALVYLLDQDTHAATTSSLVIVGISALTGMVAHARAGRVKVGSGVTFGLTGVVGAVVGSRLSRSVDPDVLLLAFAGLMLLAAVLMTYRRRRSAAGRTASSGDLSEERSRVKHVATLMAAATGVGLVTGFFGVGGGFVVVPALVLALGFSMPTAVGTSLLVISINSATALISRLGTGVSLDWALLAVFTLAAVVGSLGGNWVASRVNPDLLARAFTVLLVLIAFYTAARSVAGLSG